jgi:Ca2+-binding EF-hand superfamily protein
MEAGLYNHADAEAEESKYADPADGSLELLASPSNRDTTDIMQIAFCCESNLTSMTAVATSNQTCPACGNIFKVDSKFCRKCGTKRPEEGVNKLLTDLSSSFSMFEATEEREQGGRVDDNDTAVTAASGANSPRPHLERAESSCVFSLSKEDNDLLERAFAAADIDGDGQLQPDEVAKFVRLLSTVGRSKNRSEILERVFMSPSAKCIHCGNTYLGDSKFCRKCGNLRPPRSDDISRHEFFKIASQMLRGSDAKRMRKTFTEITRIKGIFDLCDEDGSGCLEAGEIRFVMRELGESTCSDGDANLAMGILDEDGSGAIDWVEFVEALAEGKFQKIPHRPGGPQWKNFSLDNLAAIPAAFDQVYPISDDEFRRVLSNFTFFERHAAKMLAAAEQCRKAAFENDYAHTHQLNATQRTHIFHWTFYGIAFGALMGGVSSVGTMLIDEDIQDRGYPTGGGGGDMTGFWWLVVLSTVLTIIELLVVYVAVVYVAIRISGEAGLRLWPLNPERALVAQSLVRAALELGNSNAPFMGIHATRRSQAMDCCNKVLAFLIYRWKRQLTRFILRFAVRIVVRQVVKRFIGAEEQGDDAGQDGFNIAIDFAVNMSWNAIVVRKALNDCRLAILGPPCLVELTKTVATSAPSMCLAARINLLRTVGVLVGKISEWHPNHHLMAMFFKELCRFDELENPSPKARHIEMSFDIDPFHPTGIRFRPGGLEVIELVPAGQADECGFTHVSENHHGWAYYYALAYVGDVEVQDIDDVIEVLAACRARSQPLAKLSFSEHSRIDLEDSHWSLTSRDALLESMASCDEEENTSVLAMLLLASVIDGRLNKWRTGLLAEAAERCKKTLDVARLKKLAYNFKMGLGIAIEDLAPCFLEDGDEEGQHALTCGERTNDCANWAFAYLSWCS